MHDPAHATQYAFFPSRSVFVPDTSAMSDAEVVEAATRLSPGGARGEPFTRHDHCTACDAPTAINGVLLADSSCPAVAAEVRRLSADGASPRFTPAALKPPDTDPATQPIVIDSPPAAAAKDVAIRLGVRTFRVLFPDLLRPLTGEERDALKSSVEKLGVAVAVVVDEHDGVIDGINRLSVAAELGLVHVRTDVRAGLTLEEKADLAMSLNDSRRHLSPADWKALRLSRADRMRRAVDLRLKGQSYKVIGAQLGVDFETVRKDVKAAQQLGLMPADPVTITTTDGKKRSSVELSPHDREARRKRLIRMRKRGLTVSEIAAIEGLNPNTVASQMNAARTSNPPPPPAPKTALLEEIEKARVKLASWLALYEPYQNLAPARDLVRQAVKALETAM